MYYHQYIITRPEIFHAQFVNNVKIPPLCQGITFCGGFAGSLISSSAGGFINGFSGNLISGSAGGFISGFAGGFTISSAGGYISGSAHRNSCSL